MVRKKTLKVLHLFLHTSGRSTISAAAYTSVQDCTREVDQHCTSAPVERASSPLCQATVHSVGASTIPELQTTEKYNKLKKKNWTSFHHIELKDALKILFSKCLSRNFYSRIYGNTTSTVYQCTYLHHQLSYLMSFASSKTLHSVSFWTKFWKKGLKQARYHQIQILQILTHQVLYLILKNPWIFLLAIWYMEKGIEKRYVEIKVLLF